MRVLDDCIRKYAFETVLCCVTKARIFASNVVLQRHVINGRDTKLFLSGN